jgi:predicted PolB exonuclease-like 3'-5' exonuclease
VGRPQPSYLVVDIETVPDTGVWVAPETRPGPGEGAGKPFPPPYAHRTIVVGCLWLDEAYHLRKLGVVGEGRDERGILEDFSAFVERNRPALVTYNGRSFDLPVLALRSLHHGVAMGWYYRERGVRYRYSEEGHIDLCDCLADHGATRSVSLDALARLIGLPGKLGVDGSQIEGLFNAGKLEVIQNYCLADVAQTALLFLRYRLLQGVLSADAYRAAAGELTAALRSDGRLATLMDAVDGTRLLGAAA